MASRDCLVSEGKGVDHPLRGYSLRFATPECRPLAPPHQTAPHEHTSIPHAPRLGSNVGNTPSYRNCTLRYSPLLCGKLHPRRLIGSALPLPPSPPSLGIPLYQGRAVLDVAPLAGLRWCCDTQLPYIGPRHPKAGTIPSNHVSCTAPPPRPSSNVSSVR